MRSSSLYVVAIQKPSQPHIPGWRVYGRVWISGFGSYVHLIELSLPTLRTGSGRPSVLGQSSHLFFRAFDVIGIGESPPFPVMDTFRPGASLPALRMRYGRPSVLWQTGHLLFGAFDVIGINESPIFAAVNTLRPGARSLWLSQTRRH